nr:hypothetical protein [Tanacetum cinerariifolium]
RSRAGAGRRVPLAAAAAVALAAVGAGGVSALVHPTAWAAAYC